MRFPRAPEGAVQRVRAAADPTRGLEPFVRLATRATPPVDDRSAPTYEQRLGALIGRGEAPVALEPERLERVWQRLSRPTPVRDLPSGKALRWALAATILLVSGGVVGAERRGWTWPRTVVQRLIGRPAPALPSPSSRMTLPPARQTTSAVTTPADVVPSSVAVPPADLHEIPAPPSEAPAPVKSPGRAVDRVNSVPARMNSVPDRLNAATAPTGLTEESQLLGRALARLRQQRDSHAALTELDAYTVRFPSGVLRFEARRLRVDALLMEGRLAEARSDLSALDLGPGARDRELRLIRAELVAEHACGAALADYQSVLAEGADGPLAERALWGRAVCLTRLGDEAGGRRDLAAYLARFPDGIHGPTARARLRD